MPKKKKLPSKDEAETRFETLLREKGYSDDVIEDLIGAIDNGCLDISIAVSLARFQPGEGYQIPEITEMCNIEMLMRLPDFIEEHPLSDKTIAGLVRLHGEKGAMMAIFDTYPQIETEEEAIAVIEGWKRRTSK